MFHINQVQKYWKRPENLDIDEDLYANIGVIYEENEECEQLTHIELPPIQGTKTWKDVKINEDLNATNGNMIKKLLYKYDYIFSDLLVLLIA